MLESLTKNLEEVTSEMLSLETVSPLYETPLRFDETGDSKGRFEYLDSFKSRLETVECLRDFEMVKDIVEYLGKEENIKFEKWNKLNLDEKVEVLNNVEKNIAAIEHRPPLKVFAEKMGPNNLGYQCSELHKIAINKSIIESHDPLSHRRIVETIIHEGRHAYQHYNVEVKTIHESVAEVETWKKNFFDPYYKYYQDRGQKIWIKYNDGSVHDIGFRFYAQQPVETDARNFTADTTSKLEKKGIIIAKPESCKFEMYPESEIPNLSKDTSKTNRFQTKNSIEDTSYLKVNENVREFAEGIVEYERKIENNEVGDKDRLISSVKSQGVWNNRDEVFIKRQPDAFFKVDVFEDNATKKLYVRDIVTGSLYKLHRSDIYKKEGFTHFYTDALGVDCGLKLKQSKSRFLQI